MSWGAHYNHARKALNMSVQDAKSYADLQMDLQACHANSGPSVLRRQFA